MSHSSKDASARGMSSFLAGPGLCDGMNAHMSQTKQFNVPRAGSVVNDLLHVMSTVSSVQGVACLRH